MTQKSSGGFMPRRFTMNSEPSSYAMRALKPEKRLELEKIWEEGERELELNSIGNGTRQTLKGTSKSISEAD